MGGYFRALKSQRPAGGRPLKARGYLQRQRQRVESHQRSRRTRSNSSRMRHTAPTVMVESARLNDGKYQPA